MMDNTTGHLLTNEELVELFQFLDIVLFQEAV